MEGFILGTLKAIKTGAVYNDQVWDQWLTVTLKDKVELRVFDFNCIGHGLSIGTVYQIVLRPTIFGAIQVVDSMASPNSPEWYGTIADLNWRAPSVGFQMVNPKLFKSVDSEHRGWLLVKTQYGSLIISEKELQSELTHKIEPGMNIAWSDARWDLYAVE